LTTFPISSSLASAGYQQTLSIYGCILGVVGLLAAQGLRRSPRDLSSEYQLTTEKKRGAPWHRVTVAHLLGDVLHDDDDVDIRIDGYLPDGGLREGFWRYQGGRIRHGSITFGAYDRPFHKRADTSFLWLVSDRPGANDAVSVRPRRLRPAGLVDDAP
jgi:hypothetical protein